MQENFGLVFRSLESPRSLQEILEICRWNYPLSQNDYRQEKYIFELFSGARQVNPVIAPGAIA